MTLKILMYQSEFELGKVEQKTTFPINKYSAPSDK